MADNAIEKLFEEMRIARQAAIVAKASCEEAACAHRRAMTDADTASTRVRLLERTLEKHIHENMPVVQAKMIAHEEIEQIQIADRSFTINAVSRAASASASASAAVNAQLVSITKCYAGRNNGSLNPSI